MCFIMKVLLVMLLECFMEKTVMLSVSDGRHPNVLDWFSWHRQQSDRSGLPIDMSPAASLAHLVIFLPPLVQGPSPAVWLCPTSLLMMLQLNKVHTRGVVGGDRRGHLLMTWAAAKGCGPPSRVRPGPCWPSRPTSARCSRACWTRGRCGARHPATTAVPRGLPRPLFLTDVQDRSRLSTDVYAGEFVGQHGNQQQKFRSDGHEHGVLPDPLCSENVTNGRCCCRHRRQGTGPLHRWAHTWTPGMLICDLWRAAAWCTAPLESRTIADTGSWQNFVLLTLQLMQTCVVRYDLLCLHPAVILSLLKLRSVERALGLPGKG